MAGAPTHTGPPTRTPDRSDRRRPARWFAPDRPAHHRARNREAVHSGPEWPDPGRPAAADGEAHPAVEAAPRSDRRCARALDRTGVRLATDRRAAGAAGHSPRLRPARRAGRGGSYAAGCGCPADRGTAPRAPRGTHPDRAHIGRAHIGPLPSRGGAGDAGRSPDPPPTRPRRRPGPPGCTRHPGPAARYPTDRHAGCRTGTTPPPGPDTDAPDASTTSAAPGIPTARRSTAPASPRTAASQHPPDH
ncbi:hypothetical protein GCM10010123_44990 [Pilimelia anulata]|uniref:Uncharacterized protein n=1 Tax=Pilimelia anulata TaxID=53371 RepID=A0A8J3FDG5_9ACTN|nr:hypothetical protein GCM10010123_44990 [Pilimelia anulata]